MACDKRKLSNRDASGGAQIDRTGILYGPPRLLQLPVDLDPCAIVRLHGSNNVGGREPGATSVTLERPG